MEGLLITLWACFFVASLAFLALCGILLPIVMFIWVVGLMIKLIR